MLGQGGNSLTLVLGTETNPGDADWLNSSVISGGTNTPSLIIALVGATPVAPEIVSTGPRNILYTMETDAEGTATLPLITPTLSPVWRIAIQFNSEAGDCTLEISPNIGQDILVNAVAAGSYLLVNSGSTSVTFIHDGADTWYPFFGF